MNPTITIPHPKTRPFGTLVTAQDVQEVWDAYIAPEQHLPPSVEARTLTAILRAVHAGLLAEGSA